MNKTQKRAVDWAFSLGTGLLIALAVLSLACFFVTIWYFPSDALRGQ